MAFRILESQFVDGLWYITAAGNSNDTMPEGEICAGSVYLETDTAKVYLYDETDGWTEIGGGEDSNAEEE